jgi:arylsulfatase A-like enzyme
MKTGDYSRRSFLKTAASGSMGLALSSLFLNGCSKTSKKKNNVLFIAVDDLRPELGCYGNTQIVSPNIDRLAAGGLKFVHAYCNVPVCGASRASLLTGVRPHRHRFVDYKTWADKDLPGHLSLPRYLKGHGYHTVSLGKVYHHHRQDDINAWSEKPWFPWGDWTGWQAYISEESKKVIRPNPRPGQPKRIAGPAWEIGECDDSGYPDGMIADMTIEKMRELSKSSQPFFLAAGFLKPHLPFNAPKKYWDLYKHDEIPLANNPFPPKDGPDEALHNYGELRKGYVDVPESNPLPDDYSRWLVHGYYACVSFTDAQIGRILDELDRLGLADNTTVILWGDHGWNLGEHTLWCKHCNFRTSLRAPIIVRSPGFWANQTSAALVEFVDIYPSIVELCGLPVPGHCEGTSFVPLMQDPEQQWNLAIFSRYHK